MTPTDKLVEDGKKVQLLLAQAELTEILKRIDEELDLMAPRPEEAVWDDPFDKVQVVPPLDIILKTGDC